MKPFYKKPNPDLEDRVANEKWPDRHVNWQTFTDGQKWARIRSYNSARRARGKPPIPNPYTKDEFGQNIGQEVINQDGTKTLTPKPPVFTSKVNKSIRNNPFFKRLLDSGHTTTTIRPIIDQYSKELDQLIQNAPNIDWDNIQGDELDIIDDQELMDIIWEDNKDKQNRANIDKHVNPNLSITGGKRKDVPTEKPTKVKAQPFKYQKVGEHSSTTTTTTQSSTTPDNQPEEVGPSPIDFSGFDPLENQYNHSGMANNHPGAGMDVDEAALRADGLDPGNQSGFSGQTAMAKNNINIPRPIEFMKPHSQVFEQVHELLCYGLAPAILDIPGQLVQDPPIPKGVCLVTSLMEIPWDKLFFYMTPGEYDALYPGTFVRSFGIEIIQFNARVAFEANSTDTSLATLNQNKFSWIAKGINMNNEIRTSNFKVNIAAQGGDSAMKPESLDNPEYTELDTAMYGVNNSQTTFASSIPHSLYGVPIANPNYLCIWNYDQSDEAITEKNVDLGWPNIRKHLHKELHIADKPLLKESYSPSSCFLKAQLPYAEWATNIIRPGVDAYNPNKMVYKDDNIDKTVSVTTINDLISSETANVTETHANASITKNSFRTIDSRYDVLEKGQLNRNIDSGASNKNVIPSIHVGIAPIPKLSPSSSAGAIVPTRWTDVQMYYCVKTHMEVVHFTPHHASHYGKFHVEPEKIKMGIGNSQFIYPNQPVRFGHYYTGTAATVEVAQVSKKLRV